MTIIQERLAKTGNLSHITHENVKKLKASELIREYNRPGLFVKSSTGQNIITFPTKELMMKAHEDINGATGVVLLDYNEYFAHQMISDEAAARIVNKTLGRHLKMCIEHILTYCNASLDDLNTRDAFRHMDTRTLIAIYDGQPTEIEVNEQVIILWSKTLYTPKEDLGKGVTPLQFFKSIIKNEKNHRISGVDRFIGQL